MFDVGLRQLVEGFLDAIEKFFENARAAGVEIVVGATIV